MYFGAHHKNLNGDRPILSVENCSPGILVSGRYSWGFAGEGASNESAVSENGDFRFFCSLYLPNFLTQGYNYYIESVVPLWLFTDSKIDDLE